MIALAFLCIKGCVVHSALAEAVENPPQAATVDESEPVYRLYNEYMTANEGAYSHLWTGDYNEYVTLWRVQGWKNESVAWYALSVPLPN